MERNRSDYEFEVALSFAGEQREYVDEFAKELKALNIKVFYDTYEKVNLWGKDLYQYLNGIYKNKCLFTIVFISEDYAKKRWTKHELKSAQTRAFNENSEYILPVRFDHTELPGFNETIGYLSIEGMTPKELAILTEEKLNLFGDPNENSDFEKVEIADYKKLTFIQKINPDELVGRKNDLEKLHQLLTEKKKVVVVNGMGGIGKTTLAAAYTFQFETYYQKIVWITQSQEDITNDFVQNQELIHSLNIETEGKQVDQLFAEILHALINIPEKPKLLVIDNAFESLEAHLDKLPSQPAWDLLVTSREAIEGLHTMTLDFLSEAEAIILFQKHCSRISDTEVIKELINTVEFHTLTIEILAKTAQKQRTTPEALKKALETDLKANIKTAHSKKNQIERVTSYLGAIFDFSTLSQDEVWLLKNFCALPTEFHYYGLLEELIGAESSGRQGVFAENLETLTQNGWILKDDSGEQYRLHRVIRETITSRISIGPRDILTLINNITNLLYLNESEDNPIDKFKWIPFAQACLRIKSINQWKRYPDLLCDLGLRLSDIGNFNEAKKILLQAVEYNEEHGINLPESRSYFSLGIIKEMTGDYEGAKRIFIDALASNKKKFGENHPDTSTGYSNLGIVLKNLGSLTESKVLLEKALTIDKKIWGENHPRLAIRYSNLALTLMALEDYIGAKKTFVKAISLAQTSFEKTHPNLVTCYSNLAMVLRQLGNRKEAKSLLEKVTLLDIESFGENHPNTANSYNNLALVLAELKDFQKSVFLIQRATQIFIQSFGENHPITRSTKGNLEDIVQAAREAGAID